MRYGNKGMGNAGWAGGSNRASRAGMYEWQETTLLKEEGAQEDRETEAGNK
jgi:hypothetical protein